MADMAGAQTATEEVAASAAAAPAAAASAGTGSGTAATTTTPAAATTTSGETTTVKPDGETSNGEKSGSGRGAEDRIRELTGRLHQSTRQVEQMRKEFEELKGGKTRMTPEQHRADWIKRLQENPESVYDLMQEARDEARRAAVGDVQAREQQQSFQKDVAKARKFLYRQPESEHEEYEARIKAVQDEHPELQDLPFDEMLSETMVEYRRRYGSAKAPANGAAETAPKANGRDKAADAIAKEIATGGGRGTGSDTAGGRTFFMGDIQELAAKNPTKFREMEAEIDRAMEAGRVKPGKGSGLL
jgi:hypothetical protein